MNGWRMLKLGGYIAGVLAVVVIVAAFAVLGFKLMIVLSGSMEPVMMPGDVVVVAPVDTDALTPGDIVSFWRRMDDTDIIITHRIIGIDAEGGMFTTKGDNNNAADDVLLEKDDIIGRTVFLIPYLGYTTEMKKEIMLFCMVLPSLILIIGEIRNAGKGPLTAYKEARQERKAMRAVYTIHYRRLFCICILCSLPFWIVAAPSIIGMFGGGGGDSLYSQGAMVDVRGESWLPEVYVVAPPDEMGVPRYGVAVPGDVISYPADEVSACTGVAKAPQVIPVFWVILLADIHPFLPAILIGLVPGFVLTLFAYPLWRTCHMLKKPVRRRGLVAF